MNLLDESPGFSPEQAAGIVRQHFGLQVTSCKPLASERDQNFHVITEAGDAFVLKVSNATEDRNFLEGQNEMLQHLASRIKFSPVVRPATDGQQIVVVHQNDKSHLVRLVSFLPGRPMAECRFVSDTLLIDIAAKVADIDNALLDFQHPGFQRSFHWDLAQAETVVQERLHLISDNAQRQQVEFLLDQFRAKTRPHLQHLPKSIIHNDANDGNIVLTATCDKDSLGPALHPALHADSVSGLVDFGDAVHTWTVADLAIAIAYSILKRDDPLVVARLMATHYHTTRPLNEHEVAALFGLICMRLCTSVVMAAEQTKAQPDNDYLLVSQEPIRRTLPKLVVTPFDFAHATLREAVGLPAIPSYKAVTDWLSQHRHEFAFPVNPKTTGVRPDPDKTLVLDLGVASTLIPVDVDSISEPQLTEIVFNEQRRCNATVSIGRYLEPRILYASDHFTGNDLSQENRTVHLGIDIFAVAGTDVVAPLDGEVFYLGAIDKPLDYGGLILLRHRTPSGDPFYTLYGHLNPDSYGSLKTGAPVAKGDKIAELGEPDVNGGWTPHVHFQLMLDLLDLGHEFPGVAYASQMETWSTVSPDPNLILGIDLGCFPDSDPTSSQTLAKRRERLGPSLSVAYDEPIKTVRGWKQYLFDNTGRRFLDAYNNVPHAGHCHPEVVSAIERQARLLNTNTRYLHDNVNELAERVAATMDDDDLEVCYFVNSASEANELALRLARQFTSAKQLLVTESAYHGHSTSLIDASPYKHNGPGGTGAPDWVHTIPIADTYRGKHRNPETAAEAYTNEASRIIAELPEQLCGFLVESCPSVAGQIIFPEGYLAKVFAAVRKAGGLCIADEVQTGYGRLGSHMYGFQMQQAKPDIVILGKPIGNGHPLAAVVTTREIAEAFDNGMEFFSTFGGNTVSCAAGLAVLDVLENEGLQNNARQVGNHLKEGLNELKEQFELIGDVRGQGLFLGVELVIDRETKQPATMQAKFIANQCRRLGVLIGTDGPAHNVLKIRPPMCFTNENARQLCVQLKRALAMC